MSQPKDPAAIWKYFSKKDATHSECNVCKTLYSAEHGNTSNLKRHLKAKHKMLFSDLEEIEAKKRATMRITASSHSTKVNVHSAAASQPKMHSFMAQEKKWQNNDPRQCQADVRLAKMICMDIQPINIVRDLGFRSFVEGLQPSYTLPDRRKLRSVLIPDLYQSSKEEIRTELNECMSFAVTLDHWTSASSDAYMALTAHYITKNFHCRDACLNVHFMPQSHTGENISTELCTLLQSWFTNFNDKELKIFVVTDNASDVKAASNLLPQPKFTGMSCFAHTLQLAVNDSISAFPGVGRVISKAKNIVKHFHQSPKSSHYLQEVQQRLNAKVHKLKNECPTRWNSTYYMLERLVEQREPITFALSSIEKVPNLSANEWKTDKEYVEVLMPFEETTAMMSASRYPTVSMAIPILNILSRKMKSTSVNDFGKEILNNLARRWPDLEENEVYSMASFLDPRFKQYAFSSRIVSAMIDNFSLERESGKKSKSGSEFSSIPSAQSVQSVVSLSLPAGQCAANVESSSCQESVAESTPGPGDTWGSFREMVSQQKERENQENDINIVRMNMESELELYSRETLVEPTGSPYDWWRGNNSKYPNVAKLARVYLAIPATSVPSERMFSKAGAVISERRTNLKPENAEMLICLSHNLRK